MMQSDFVEWQDETLKSIELWTIRLKNESLKQKTYGQAISFLKKNRPGMPGSYHARSTEQFQNVVRSMFDEAEQQIWDELKKKEIEHEKQD